MYVYSAVYEPNLFSDVEEHLNDVLDSAIAGPAVELLPVDGLTYVPEFITADEERALLDAVETGEWVSIWQRRTQFYGSKYDGWENEGANLIPCWAVPYASRLLEQGLFGGLPNQMGVNEYLPGQGIAPHVDRHGGPVSSLSLGSGCVMDLVSLFGKPTVSFWRAPRSLIVFEGEARSAWKHGIARRQKDVVDGVAYRRRRRVSLTFRMLVHNQ